MDWFEKFSAGEIAFTVFIGALALFLIGGFIAERNRRENNRGDAMFREANKHDNDDDPMTRQA